MKLTMDILNSGRSDNGSWSWKQLKCFGIHTQHNPGWLKRALGTDVTSPQVDKFLSLKNKHLGKGKKLRAEQQIRRLPEWIIENCYDDHNENAVVAVEDLLGYFNP